MLPPRTELGLAAGLFFYFLVLYSVRGYQRARRHRIALRRREEQTSGLDS